MLEAVSFPAEEASPSRTALGRHYSPESFYSLLRPYLLPFLRTHLFADLFAGAGNLLLPLLREIPPEERGVWALKHLLLVDIEEEAVVALREALRREGLSPEAVRTIARRGDSLRESPPWPDGLPVFHVTNPPYLYLGRIRKDASLRHLLPLFANARETDLYALALRRDLQHPQVVRAAYVLPASFLNGKEGEGIRRSFLDAFRLEALWLWEVAVFPDTDILVGLFLFARKPRPLPEAQRVPLRLVGANGVREGLLLLRPERNYRPGEEFWSFVEAHQPPEPLRYRLYLPLEEVANRPGPVELDLVDASRRIGGGYARFRLGLEPPLAEALRSSPLYLRTLDSGRWEGRAGIRPASELGGEAVVFSGKPHRTHPIALLFQGLDQEGSLLAAQAFNLLLEHFRDRCQSLFLADYKGSRSARYPRKYLGLETAKALLGVFPQDLFFPRERGALREALGSGEALLRLLEKRGR